MNAMLQQLKHWSESGLLRRLDWALARLMTELDPAACAPVLLCAALTAHLEGRGHSCLLLDELWRDAPGLLAWPPEPAAEYRAMAAASLPSSPAGWLSALHASPLVWVEANPLARVGDDSASAPPAQADHQQPLVLRGHRLYLRRYWRCEKQVARQVLQRVADPDPVDEAAAREWLARLFPAASHGPASQAASAIATGTPATADSIDWQQLACAVALRGRLSVITGGPGTGKTYTAARLLALLFAIDPEPQRLRVALAAPTGKAAARLKQSIGDALQGLGAQLQGHLPEGLSLADLVTRMGAARTLHSLLGARPDTRRFTADAAHPLAVDVLIVDEASMVHLEMMAALLEALPPRARLILLGDKDQLASVEAGAVLGDLCREAEQGAYGTETARYLHSVTGQVLPQGYLLDGQGPAQHGLAFDTEPPAGSALAQQTVMLRTSRRFSGPIGQLALAANAGAVLRANELLKRHADRELAWLDSPEASAVVALALDGRPGAEGGYAGPGSYLARLALRPKPPSMGASLLPGAESAHDAVHRAAFDTWVMSVLTAFDRFRLLCAVREGEWGAAGLNTAIERALVARGQLSGRGEWYEGRPVMVTRNDPGVGVFNGDIGVVLRPFGATASGANAAPLRAWFLDGPTARSVSVSRLAQVDTAFALTVHKSQGSEFDHTVLVLPQQPSRVLTRELVYTGITRARSAFTLATGRRAALAEALGQRTQRASGLVELLNDTP